MGHLQKVYAISQPDFEAHYRPGQAVVVLFAQDEQFYRAVIREVVGNKYKVSTRMTIPRWISTFRGNEAKIFGGTGMKTCMKRVYNSSRYGNA